MNQEMKEVEHKLSKENELNFLIEWAVWANLDSKNDLELLLLKGHLLLEGMLEIVLKRNGVEKLDNCSFYKKICELEKIMFLDVTKRQEIIFSLKKVNRLRNLLAHEYFFKIEDGEFASWGSEILRRFEGKKFSKYTQRTMLVHAFSVLSINLFKLQ